MGRYWAVWFIVSMSTFLVPETIALIRNRTQDTLSDNVWRLERLVPGQDITQWSAFHILFTGSLIVVLGWLIGHFGWGLWR